MGPQYGFNVLMMLLGKAGTTYTTSLTAKLAFDTKDCAGEALAEAQQEDLAELGACHTECYGCQMSAQRCAVSTSADAMIDTDM